MPTSDPEGIAPVIRTVMSLRPPSILDVGIGMGKWAMLFREYLEAWHFHRYSRDQWQGVIDGVEAYGAYVQPWHRELYNQIYIGDVRKLAPDLGYYAMVYMGDVIEHMPKADGHALLATLRFRHCIVSTPLMRTQAKRGKPNAYLDHLSQWNAADFKPYRHKVIHSGKLLVVVVMK